MGEKGGRARAAGGIEGEAFPQKIRACLLQSRVRPGKLHVKESALLRFAGIGHKDA
jgi:hypothetical protein